MGLQQNGQWGGGGEEEGEEGGCFHCALGMRSLNFNEEGQQIHWKQNLLTCPSDNCWTLDHRVLIWFIKIVKAK